MGRLRRAPQECPRLNLLTTCRGCRGGAAVVPRGYIAAPPSRYSVVVTPRRGVDVRPLDRLTPSREGGRLEPEIQLSPRTIPAGRSQTRSQPAGQHPASSHGRGSAVQSGASGSSFGQITRPTPDRASRLGQAGRRRGRSRPGYVVQSPGDSYSSAAGEVASVESSKLNRSRPRNVTASRITPPGERCTRTSDRSARWTRHGRIGRKSAPGRR